MQEIDLWSFGYYHSLKKCWVGLADMWVGSKNANETKLFQYSYLYTRGYSLTVFNFEI